MLSGGVLCSSACLDVLSLEEFCLSKDLGFCSLFYLGYFCIAPWESLSGLCTLWYSLSSFPSLWLGRCTLGWPVWPVIGYPSLDVHPGISIVRLIMIGYCCNCWDGQLNYWASAQWLISVTTMYQLCNQWLGHSTITDWEVQQHLKAFSSTGSASILDIQYNISIATPGPPIPNWWLLLARQRVKMRKTIIR